eukprot:768389-Pelagomonas_calceolata.AAC.1
MPRCMLPAPALLKGWGWRPRVLAPSSMSTASLDRAKDGGLGGAAAASAAASSRRCCSMVRRRSSFSLRACCRAASSSSRRLRALHMHIWGKRRGVFNVVLVFLSIFRGEDAL